MKSLFTKTPYLISGFIVLFLSSFSLVYFTTPFFGTFSYNAPIATTTLAVKASYQRPTTHFAKPSSVKAVYMTACTASSKNLREKLVMLINETEINSVVIDIKDYTGRISYQTKNQDLSISSAKGSESCFVSDMQDFIDELHKNEVYVIGRISVFQDKFMVKNKPELAVKKRTATSTPWQDRKGISWIDVSAKEHWNYISLLAHDAWSVGFDEVNFDYIRFPSDGDMKDIYYPFSKSMDKSTALELFFSYLQKSLSDIPIKMSADLFGMTTTNHDDLSIGQVLEKALPYFDFIDPMVYPSHYSVGFNNLGDPNKHPYEVVDYSLKKGIERTIATTTKIDTLLGESIASTTPTMYTKPSYDRQAIRPWLQDFNYPVPYTAEMVRTQIQATYDNGLTSWILWSPSNRYTREALKDETRAGI